MKNRFKISRLKVTTPSFPGWMSITAVVILLACMFAADVLAAPSRSLISLERKRDRILRLAEAEKANTQQTIDQLEQIQITMAQRSKEFQATITMLIEQMDDQLCALGLEKMCPPEPEPEVSTGHTVLVSMDLLVTKYTNRRVENDATPCDAAGVIDGMNICHAYNEGIRPLALSQDLTPYPLWWGDTVKLTSNDKRAECVAAEGIYTIFDHMNERYRNRADIFTKCSHPDCMEEVAKARAFGVCNMRLTKL